MQNNINTQGFKELPSGTTLCNGKYTIAKKIGEGGFGITYKAVQNGLDRTVCIKEYFLEGKCIRNTVAKTIHLQDVSAEMFKKYRQAFVNEARIVSNLKHSNIVEVVDIFDENNTSYMVMSFIEGQTLQDLVETHGMLNYGIVVNYLGQIASAVGYIHTQHILHRDIKPDNIIITPDHHAVLIDFGSAREFVNDKTQAHTSILTKCYAPPEQYNKVSRKGNYTDIYALGAVYYFAMTGRVPLEAAVRNIERMPEPKELNSNVTDDVNRTIMKAMALKPENRHQTIQEFMDDLLGVKPSAPIEDNNVVIVKKSYTWLWGALIGAGIIIILIIGAMVKKNKQLRLQQEISAAAKVVSDSIRSDTVYFQENETHYHLFTDCPILDGKIYKGTIRESFEWNATQTCETCFSRVSEYRRSIKEANDFKKLGDDLDDRSFYDSALEWCDKVLKMRPDDNIRVIKLKEETTKLKQRL